MLITFCVFSKGRLFFLQAVDKPQQHQHIAFIQLLHPIQGLLDQLRILLRLIKKFLGGHIQILTDGKELLHGRQSLPGRDIINVSPAVAQVIAHLVFRNPFFQPKLCDPVPHKRFFHHGITS